MVAVAPSCLIITRTHLF